MSNKNYARRTVVKLYFKGADISKELSKYLLSLSFTDKEEDETDDISLSLDDREGKWIKDWLNTSKAVKTKTETVTTGGGEIKVGAIVKFKGGPVYISSMAAEPTVNRGASTCKCTIANHNAHPYHLISQDGQRVYGWCNAFLGVNPKKMQDKIDKYRKKGKILTLIIGGKKYGSQWVITGHSKDYEKFDNQGNLLIAKSTLSLEQYAKR